MEKSGFTLTELLVVIFLLGVVFMSFGLIGGVTMGNYWVEENSALKAAQVTDESAISVITLERHIWAYSRVVVKDQDGNRQSFYLDSNLLQNVRAIPTTDF